MVQVSAELFGPSAGEKGWGKSNGREQHGSEPRAATGLRVGGRVAAVLCQREPRRWRERSEVAKAAAHQRGQGSVCSGREGGGCGGGETDVRDIYSANAAQI